MPYSAGIRVVLSAAATSRRCWNIPGYVSSRNSTSEDRFCLQSPTDDALLHGASGSFSGAVLQQQSKAKVSAVSLHNTAPNGHAANCSLRVSSDECSAGTSTLPLLFVSSLVVTVLFTPAASAFLARSTASDRSATKAFIAENSPFCQRQTEFLCLRLGLMCLPVSRSSGSCKQGVC